MRQPADPQTPEEWQTAVNMAEFVLTIDSLEQYGLIKTDLLYNRERAHNLLQTGATHGYFPAATALSRYYRAASVADRAKSGSYPLHCVKSCVAPNTEEGFPAWQTRLPATGSRRCHPSVLPANRARGATPVEQGRAQRHP